MIWWAAKKNKAWNEEAKSSLVRLRVQRGKVMKCWQFSWWLTHLINPIIIAIILSTIRTQWDTSARYIAKSLKFGWWMSTKNNIKHIRDPTRRSNPKNKPLEAPTQSTRPCWAWAKATARLDSITSRRCSRSSWVTYLKCVRSRKPEQKSLVRLIPRVPSDMFPHDVYDRRSDERILDNEGE